LHWLHPTVTTDVMNGSRARVHFRVAQRINDAGFVTHGEICGSTIPSRGGRRITWENDHSLEPNRWPVTATPAAQRDHPPPAKPSGTGPSPRTASSARAAALERLPVSQPRERSPDRERAYANYRNRAKRKLIGCGLAGDEGEPEPGGHRLLDRLGASEL